MSVFKEYADYYDLLYSDKDYRLEANHVLERLQAYGKSPRRILDLGCGTGNHALHWAEKGVHVTGMDFSENNVRIASEKAAGDPKLRKQTAFIVGDIRQARADGAFDAAVSLFHVISYQTTNASLIQALQNTNRHLTDGGLFLFDCWYGPAVLNEMPSARIKKVSREDTRVIRLADPVLRLNDNCVDVHYHLVALTRNGKSAEINEKHTMRYFFFPEIHLLAEIGGFEVLDAWEWMSGKPLDGHTWSACFLCRKKETTALEACGQA